MVEEQRGERPQRLIGRAPFARVGYVDGAAGCAQRGAGTELVEPGLSAPLAEHADELFVHAGAAGERHPLEMRAVHHYRRRIAGLGIFERSAVHVRPDRLVAVHVALARFALVAPEHAALERPQRLELAHPLLYFLARQIARAAAAAELQHDRRRGRAAGLRTVGGALREEADHAGRHLAVAGEVEVAFELEAELLEIVPVARRDEVLVIAAHGELRIVARSGRAFHQVAEVEGAAAMLEAAGPRQFVALRDFHQLSPVELLGPHAEEPRALARAASRSMAISSICAAILRDATHPRGATLLRLRAEQPVGLIKRVM